MRLPKKTKVKMTVVYFIPNLWKKLYVIGFADECQVDFKKAVKNFENSTKMLIIILCIPRKKVIS